MKASAAQFQRFLTSLGDMMKREKRYGWMLLLSWFFFFLTLALPVWKIAPLASEKPFIPLHYNVLFGIDRFGAWWHIFWIPAFCLIVLLTNMILAALMYQKEKLIATILMSGTLAVQLILFCSMILIVLVNL